MKAILFLFLSSSFIYSQGNRFTHKLSFEFTNDIPQQKILYREFYGAKFSGIAAFNFQNKKNHVFGANLGFRERNSYKDYKLYDTIDNKINFDKFTQFTKHNFVEYIMGINYNKFYYSREKRDLTYIFSYGMFGGVNFSQRNALSFTFHPFDTTNFNQIEIINKKSKGNQFGLYSGLKLATGFQKDKFELLLNLNYTYSLNNIPGLYSENKDNQTNPILTTYNVKIEYSYLNIGVIFYYKL